MSPIEWLCDKSGGFQELAPHERDAIMHFCLLWSYFEGQALGNNASWRKIVEFARRWAHPERMTPASLGESFTYFQNRYFQDDELTWRFTGLFRENENREALALVRPVLRNDDTDNGNRLAALLLIIYRLRNRLMHGDKWDEDLKGQIDNFTHANNVLMAVLQNV